MGFKCAIVGLPNVGKSTLFNCLTNSKIAADNYPFCTIDPNIGVVNISDKRLDKIAEIVKPKKIIPNHIEFVDIAGLVKGASKGDGLGNEFLTNIRGTQAIAQVVRCFTGDNIIHVHGKVDPLNDIDTINTELILADLELIEKSVAKNNKLIKNSNNKEQKTKLEALIAAEKILSEGKKLIKGNLDKEFLVILKDYQLLTLKPMMYIANISENKDDYKFYEKVVNYAKVENSVCVKVCASLEEQICDMTKNEKLEFLNEINVEELGLDSIIKSGHTLLGLATYFTAGDKEVRAWTFKQGAKAPEVAGTIHSDFEKGFIRAEVISYNDFITLGGKTICKEKGKLRLEGKEYLIQDGDVVHFRFNV